MFVKLVQLHKENTLSEMVRRGLMSPAVLHKLEVVMWIDARMTSDKTLKKTQAVKRAALQFGRPEVYIWRCLRDIY